MHFEWLSLAGFPLGSANPAGEEGGEAAAAEEAATADRRRSGRASWRNPRGIEEEEEGKSNLPVVRLTESPERKPPGTEVESEHHSLQGPASRMAPGRKGSNSKEDKSVLQGDYLTKSLPKPELIKRLKVRRNPESCYGVIGKSDSLRAASPAAADHARRARPPRQRMRCARSIWNVPPRWGTPPIFVCTFFLRIHLRLSRFRRDAAPSTRAPRAGDGDETRMLPSAATSTGAFV